MAANRQLREEHERHRREREPNGQHPLTPNLVTSPCATAERAIVVSVTPM